MPTGIRLLNALFVLVLAGCSHRASTSSYGDDLDALVAATGGHGGGIFQVATAKGVIWEGASGSREGIGSAPMQPADTFEVASITKTLTATLVLQLAEEGRLTLDQPIGSLLPEAVTRGLLVMDGHDYTREITVRQLLNHTSGLPDYWWDPPYLQGRTNAFLAAFMADAGRPWTPSELLAYVRGLIPLGIPGKAPFHYSDANFVLLGLIIEALDQRPLHEAMRARLFQPLGMTNTYMSYKEGPVSAVPESHRFEGALDLYGRPNQSADWGGGGLVSSTRDLSTFLFALAGGRILKQPASLAAMQQWEAADQAGVVYGLGLYGIQLDGGDGMLWGHDGYGGAFMYYWPKRGIAFTGTLNQTDADWWPLVERAISRLE